jgi:hypothetical protein
MFFPLYYLIAFYNEYSMFFYYPLVGEIRFSHQLTTLGPAMGFYSWILVAIVGAALSAVVVPAKWRDSLWLGWLWLGPMIATVFTLIYMCRWMVPGALN